MNAKWYQYQPSASARIRFKASHPHGFAMFSFSTTRGTVTDVSAANATGQVNVATANDFERAASVAQMEHSGIWEWDGFLNGSRYSLKVVLHTRHILLRVTTPTRVNKLRKIDFLEKNVL